MFVCKLLQSFEPVLNYEHSAFKWFNINSVSAMGNLHPVVRLIFSEPLVKQLAVATYADPDAVQSDHKIKKLGAGLLFV